MFKNLLIAGLAAIVVPAFAAEWMTDLNAAKTKAAAENKAVLVDFTGSDWCRYCILLKKNVFDTPEFETYAADKFVLVEIDVPNDVSRVGGAENAAKNQALCQEYQISGFPTIMVMNAEGNVLGGFVGGQPDVQSAVKPLNAALTNGSKLAEAEKLQGTEKAKALL
ncbi:MAG: thioredoxin family protein, partial [Akkermansia sp.]|nr:thioredoxin family protein [Akkermansia sp.]